MKLKTAGTELKAAKYTLRMAGLFVVSEKM